MREHRRMFLLYAGSQEGCLVWKNILAVAGIIAFCGTVCRAQTESGAMPSFDAASIRSNAQCYQSLSKPPEITGRGEVYSMKLFRPFPPSFQLGGRYSGCAPLIEFIMDAYQLLPWQITGGPEWIRKAQFQIEAIAGMDAERDQMRLMLQSLLSERFRLKIHRQSKEVEVYSLVVADGGHKLKPAMDEHGKPITSRPTAEDLRKKYETAMRGQNLYEAVDQIGPWAKGDSFQTSIGDKAATMKSLATSLRKKAGKIVIDKTGIPGVFDVELHFENDSPQSMELRQRHPELIPPGPAAPPFFKAIEKQLGLKLVPDKAMLEFIEIDSVEMPSKN
jgi:uncharacterized protein (TIGR03435 family)